MYNNLNNRRVKILFIGPENQGKSTIIHTFKNLKKETASKTIAVDFHNIFKDNVYYDIWDTSGNPKFKDVLNIYYKGVDKIALVISINDNIDTIINNYNSWIENIKRNSHKIGAYKLYVVFTNTDKLDTKQMQNKKSTILKFNLFTEDILNNISFINSKDFEDVKKLFHDHILYYKDLYVEENIETTQNIDNIPLLSTEDTTYTGYKETKLCCINLTKSCLIL